MKTEIEELLDQAELALNNKTISEAEKHLAAALNKEKQNPRGYYLLGQLYYEKGQFAHAISAYKKTLVLDPQYVDASISLSVLYNDLGQYEEGGMIFNRALRSVETHKQGSDPFINDQLAQKHMEVGDLYNKYLRHEEAVLQYEKANHAETRLKLSQTLHKKGEKTRAYDELKKLKKDSPHFYPGRVALGLLQYSMGHVIEAVEEWEKVLEKDPNNEKAVSYLKMAKNADTTLL
jgi:tetratricopeptide (TPR) repeat protein